MRFLRFYILRTGKCLLWVFFCLPVLPSVHAQQQDFDFVYKEINAHINSNAFPKNYTLIKELESAGTLASFTCYQKGKIYHKMGVSYYLDYQEPKAINAYAKSLQFWENCKEVSPEEVANTVFNQGISYQYLGNQELAKNKLDKALAAFEIAQDYPREKLADKYHGVGLFYEGIDDFFRANLYFTDAIRIFENEDMPIELIKALNDKITLHLDFKEYQKALSYVNQALSVASENPDDIPDLNKAMVYLNAGTINFELDRITKARELADQAISLLDQNDNSNQYAIALEIRAFCAIENQDFKLAEELLTEVLQIKEQFYQYGSGSEFIALAHENLAEMYVRKGDLNKAENELKKGFEIVMPKVIFDGRTIPIISLSNALDDNVLIRLMELKTRIFETKYASDKDYAWLQHSLNVQHKIDSVIKRGLASFQFEQSKLDFLDIRFKHYGKAVKDALRLYDLTDDRYYLKEAYQFSAKTKALVLQQELNRVNALRTNVSDKTLKQEEDLRTTMNERRRLLSEAQEKQRDSLLQDYIKAQNELDYFLSDIEKNEPDYYRERYRFFNVPSVSEVQKKLTQGLAAVEFFVAEDRIYTFWMTPENFFNTSTEWNKELKNAVQAFSDYCASPDIPFDWATSQLLYDRLLGEGLKKLEDVERLCFIPDGELHSLSFEALQRAGKYLIEDYAISYTYAAALIDRKREATEIPEYTYVGFGADYSDSLNTKLKAQKRFFGDEGLSKLALSQEEVESSAALFEGKTFIGQEATLENYFEHADDARIVHLSLHGLVDADDPDRSCIIFDDSKEEFLLSPKDLYRNQLKANLVLLSACHSASGKIYNGEGVQGMSKAFLLGGARNILSSLWNASESSSLAITNSFLKGVKNEMPNDLALQYAKMDYLDNAAPSQRHPYYWANFILLGETEAISQANPSWYIFIFVVLAILLTTLLFLRRRRQGKRT